jgi:glycosyltransferase involved in cell wall biosynthesis
VTLRIAFYAPLKAPTHPVPSGDRRMGRLLMRALALAGHDVRLACTLRTRDDGRVPGRADRIAALGARAADRLVRRWRAAPPDLWFTYHLYHKAPDPIGPRVAGALGIPYVCAEASHAPRRATGPWAAGHAAAAAAIRGADAVIHMTAHDRPALAAIVDGGRLHALAPFVETAPFAAAARDRDRHRAALAARFGLPGDAPWLLAVGMMREGDKMASWRHLARALARVADRPWTLLAVGDGPRRACVEAAFGTLDPARVRFTGALEPDDLAGVYAAADLYVWPAVNEAYGMAPLEAQAAGVPVVAGRTGGVPDVVADGRSGVLVPVGDDAAFALAVADLLDDPDRRRAMGRWAAANVAARHDIAGAALRLDAILREALRNGRP